MTLLDRFRGVPPRRETCTGSGVPRHVHDRAYAAVVLAGSYEEWGSRGRFRAAVGDVLFHRAFDAHLDRFSPKGAVLLNLEVPSDATEFESGHILDVDRLARAAEKNGEDAVQMLLHDVVPQGPCIDDWQDILATRILANAVGPLGQWALEQDLAPETLSRGFYRRYGLTPAAFRLETRARDAYFHVVQGELSLADIAVKCGFADQAHMTRAVHALTGASPGRLRLRSN